MNRGQESEDYFRSLYKNTPVIMHSIDQEGKLVNVSNLWLATFGYTREEVIGKKSTEFLTEESARIAREQVIPEFLRTGSCTDIPYQFVTKNGLILDIQLSATAMRDASNRIIMSLAVLTDVTARNRAVKALRESEHRYQAMLEDQSEFICRFKSDGTILYVNDAFCRLFGKSRDELVGHKWQPVVVPEDLPKIKDKLDTLSPPNPVVTIENRVIDSCGDIRWVQFSNRAIFDKQGNLIEIQSVGRDITDKKKLEIDLATNEKEFRLLAEAMPQIVWITRPDGWNIYFNQQWVDYTGLTLEESYGHGWNKPFHIDDQKRAWDAWQNAVNNNGTYSLECRLRRSDGEYRWWLVRGVPVLDTNGNIIKWFGTCTDIHEIKQTEQDLQVAATAFEAEVGIMVTDADVQLIKVNKAFCENSGYSPDEVIGKNPRILKSGKHDANFYKVMWNSINQTGSWQGEIWDRRKNGEIYPKWMTLSAIKDKGGNVTHYVSTQHDISERKAAEKAIENLAFYDPLTQLPNRRLLLDRLRQALATSERTLNYGAILFIDLDNFKIINDTLGHNVGDFLLQQVAQRLKTCVRAGDSAARLGGDEFVLMLEELSQNILDASAKAESIGEKILATLNQPYQLGTHNFQNTPSIGITLFNGQQYEPEELFKQADIAMYQAKKAGRNTLQFFDPQMQASIDSRSVLEAELRNAIENDEFRLYYQLQVVGSHDNLPIGAEALIRWMHPERGLVSPVEFIPIAEETGLILPIGLWVLETACKQLVKWSRQTDMAQLIIAVNVSAHQFHQFDFTDQVLEVIERTGVNPLRLKLELTESMLLTDIEGIITKMNILKARGVSFSLDDFGTGYSSLAYLSLLPLDQLKIDQSFVKNLENNDNSVAISSATISMAHSLNLKVVAEGVETETQNYILGAVHRCDYLQGYLFGKPVPIERFEELIRRS